MKRLVAFLFVSTFAAAQQPAADQANRPGQDVVNAKRLNSVLNANLYPGRELGEKINAAFGECNTCTVFVPKGTYSITATINYPVMSSGTAALIMDAGTVLNPTTANPVIQAKPSVAISDPNILIQGGAIVCATDACRAGVGLDLFVGGKVASVTVSGFTSGYGVILEGANTLTFDSVVVNNNQTGFYLAPVNIFGQNYAPNAIHIINSSIGRNKGWAIFGQRKNYSGAPTSDFCLNNTYQNDVIEDNGSGSNGGGIFDSCAVGLTISGNYFENNAQNMVLGQQTGPYAGNVTGVSILNNYFTVSPSLSTTIRFGGTNGGISNTVIGNTEFGKAAQGSCFVSDSPDNGQPTILSNTIVSSSLFCGAPTSLLMGAGVIGFPVPVIARGKQNVSGCSLAGAVGGAAAGQFTSGSTSCTVTITPGITAPNGFYCSAHDLTAPTNTLSETATTTTACTISGTVGSGDTIVWQVGYAY